MRHLKIGNFDINDDSDMYVIAEIGHNHQGEIAKAIELFHAAKEAGCNAVKLQKRDNRALFTKAGYERPYDNRNSYGATYGEHREYLEFGKKEYVDLAHLARDLGMDFFSTAFDFPSVDFLEEINMPAYKVASGDIRTTPLLRRIASTGKPVIISTGGATMDDIKLAYDTIMPINKQLCVMHCTAGYPPEWEELNLRSIETLRQTFPDIVIGYSGHDSGIAMALATYCLGARIVEKHFTLNRAMKGTDHAFSLEPSGMGKMIRDLRRAKIAMGDGVKVFYPSEAEPVRKMGKSVYAASDLDAGHVITEEDMNLKSPGGFMEPYEYDNLIGKKLKVAVKEDDPFAPDNFDD